MSLFNVKRDQILTGTIIAVSLAGILFFGYMAIRENSKRNQDNPFEYDIENFKSSDAALVHYSEIGRISIDSQNVYGISVGPDDEIYVSGHDSVFIFNSDGTMRSIISTGEPVYCLIVDGNQDVYAGMDDHVEIYDRTGVKKTVWESIGEEAIITSIAVTRENVFVADAGNQTVWKFDKSGNQLKRIGDRDEARDIPGYIIPSPFFDVAVDQDGFLWVANTGRHSLENYTQNGEFRTSWGEFSMGVEGFSGCCNPSHFVILEDGSFVTSEKGIARVKVYNRLGELVSVVAEPDQFIEGTVGLDLAVDRSQRICVLDPKQKLVRIFERKKL